MGEFATYFGFVPQATTNTIISLHLNNEVGLLFSIDIDAAFVEVDDIYNTVFYLDGQELTPVEIFDYEDGTYELTFDTENHQIFFYPNQEFQVQFLMNSAPGYFEAYFSVMTFSA